TQRFQYHTAAYQTEPNYNVPSQAQSGYDSLIYTSTLAQQGQPLLYNVLNAGRILTGSGGTQFKNNDTPFTISENLYYLIGSASGPNYKRSALYQLGVQASLDSSASARYMLTPLSFDFDTPGARPWITDPSQAPYQLTQPNPGDPASKYQP